ncbi:NnrS family protein [Sinirhodobacter sp. WL0062]|uniref:NnrS family protein n=1 Tax=Rhodobacter flavimaris TaxID=2907145 RepID=A0ABS8Z0Z1_9RHOB|nr:NnrS family protein [Sinirhodobacter sp. WL0062]MCE5974336.1 NnrS family protein [Sinirhodobacter sp. WL0062]
MTVLSAPWRAPHLSLFALAALWAAVAPMVWVLNVGGWPADPVAWHRHELMFGMGGAAIGGYLLTAASHWTGRRFAPGLTQAVVAAWCAARIGYSAGAGWLGLLYPVLLAAVLVQAVWATRRWPRLPIASMPLALFAAELAMLSGHEPDATTLIFGFGALIAVVGGRILPAFLRARVGDESGREWSWVNALADSTVLALPVFAAVGVAPEVVGVATILAACAQVLRMVRWPMQAVAGQGDLMLLLLAWAWLPAGLALAGSELLFEAGGSLGRYLHMLALGAMGGMIFAVAARAYMRRVPGRLVPGHWLRVGFGLVWLSVPLRLVPELLPDGLRLSALIWCAGWGCFLCAALPAIWCDIPHPVLSARRAGQTRSIT